jgi:hypothetical protein
VNLDEARALFEQHSQVQTDVHSVGSLRQTCRSCHDPWPCYPYRTARAIRTLRGDLEPVPGVDFVEVNKPPGFIGGVVTYYKALRDAHDAGTELGNGRWPGNRRVGHGPWPGVGA